MTSASSLRTAHVPSRVRDAAFHEIRRRRCERPRPPPGFLSMATALRTPDGRARDTGTAATRPHGCSGRGAPPPQEVAAEPSVGPDVSSPSLTTSREPRRETPGSGAILRSQEVSAPPGPAWRVSALALARQLRRTDPTITKQDLATAISKMVEGAPRSFNLLEEWLRTWERAGEIPAKQST